MSLATEVTKDTKASDHEMAELLSWMGDPPRHPHQTHGLNESDCEVVALGNGTYLATTVDTVSEEIESGLYQDPYKIGWVTAMASLSDLAAVGADPVGMLLSAEWGAGWEIGKKAQVARGFSDALRNAGTYWLGGDTGRGRSTVLGGVAVGMCSSQPLSRLGMKEGDAVCVTGSLGNGPALAIRFMLGQNPEAFAESHFEPHARLKAGQALRELAHAAMDTSDGLLQTLNALRLLNGSGLELVWSDEIISEPARRYCIEQNIPLRVLWEIEHGDYQLVAAIPQENLAKAKALVPDLHCIGRVSREPGIRLSLPNGRVEAVDPDCARRLLKATQNRLTPALLQFIEHARKNQLP
jgi:thiamine-monophosphate kinase